MIQEFKYFLLNLRDYSKQGTFRFFPKINTLVNFKNEKKKQKVGKISLYPE